MKKLFSTLLAAALVAGSAISANAAAGLYTYDESDGEYWNAAFEMLDKVAPQFVLEDGTIAGYNDPSYTDATGAVYPADMARGWYEVILCNLGTKPEWFPAEVSGKAALVVRGDSTFTVKSENAKNAGAIACLVGNNCRAVELVDETGTMTGEYENVTMTVDYYTIPQCSLSSDITVRLVSQTADIAIADAVVAVEDVFFGDLELSVSHKKPAYVFFGTLEEYEANKTRTDANTVTAGGGIGGGAATTTTEAAAPAAEATASAGLPAAYPVSGSEVPADSVLIAGELIGSELGWDGTAGSGRASAFDGNIDTFFDPATASVDWCGIDAGEEMILTKIMIHPRTTYLDRFDGATIEASNDPEFEESVEIFYNANGAAPEIAFVDCTGDIDADANTGYRYFRYINYMQHGDVAEVELYGKAKDGSNPTYGGAAAPAASASTAAPAAEVEPTLLWDFNSDEAMNDVLGGANAMSFFGDTIDGVECYEFLASGNDPYVPVNMPADNVEDVFWAKARVKNPSYATAIELFGATNGRSLSGPECTHIDVKSEDEGWYTYLIYIPDENVKTANAFKGASLTETYWEGTVEYIRLDAMWREGDDGSDSGGNMAGGESIYIDYIAFFPTKEAALAFRTADDNYAFPEQAGGAAAPAATEAPAAEATDVVAIEAYDAYQEYPAVDPIANSGAGYATAEEAVAAIGKTAISGYTFVSGTTGFGNEGPENLWDGDTATKFCSNEFPTTAIAALDGEYTIDGIIMATANDNAEYNQRSPYEWAIYGSKDGAAWTAIAYGDDYFFEETNFTYYAAAVNTTDAYKYIMFQSEGGLSGTFQVSEVAVTGTKVEAAAPVVEEPAPVVEEAPAVEEAPVVEEEVVETPAEEVVEEEVEAPAAEEAVEEAPQTFDFGVIAVVAALVSAAGYALSKKR